MSRKTLLTLGAAAGVLLGWAIWLGGVSDSDSSSEPRTLLIPFLADRLDSVERLRITGAGAKTLVTLARTEAGWVVSERNDWLADVGQLRDFLLSLSQARKLEAKTALSRNYSQLGVEDSTEPASKGVRLDIAVGDDSAALIIGLNNPNGRGSFVRVPGQAQSWLTDTDLAVERNPARWLSRSLLSIAETDLAEVQLQPSDGDAVQITRGQASDSDAWILVDLPDARRANPSALSGAAGFLDGLRLEDVKRAAAPERSPERVARFVRQDGLRVTLRLWPDEAADVEVGAMPWAAIDVDVDQARAEEHHILEWRKDQRALAAISEPALGSEGADAGDGQPADVDPAGAAPAPSDSDAEVVTEAARDVALKDQEIAKIEAPAGERPGEDAASDETETSAGPSTLDVAERRAATRAEAESLDARFDGWLFKLPAFKLAGIDREYQDFLSPEP